MKDKKICHYHKSRNLPNSLPSDYRKFIYKISKAQRKCQMNKPSAKKKIAKHIHKLNSFKQQRR